MSRHSRMYDADGKNLATMVWGQAGSGKSFFIEHTVKEFLRSNKNENLRVIYVSPKNEGFADKKPVFELQNVFKRLKKERFVAWWPYIEELNAQIDELINAVFDLKQANPKMRCTIILDDAQVFLSSRKAASDAQKRLALTGRSKNIKAVYVAHNIVFARELEGQVDLLLGFSNPNPIYYKQSIERFNFDPEPFTEPLREVPYSFVWFDTREGQPKLMSPLDTSKRQKPESPPESEPNVEESL